MRVANVYEARQVEIKGMMVNCVVNTTSSTVHSSWSTSKECYEMANSLNKLIKRRYLCHQISKKFS